MIAPQVTARATIEQLTIVTEVTRRSVEPHRARAITLPTPQTLQFHARHRTPQPAQRASRRRQRHGRRTTHVPHHEPSPRHALQRLLQQRLVHSVFAPRTVGADEAFHDALGVVLDEVLAWVRTQPGTSSLRALVAFDEVFGFLPPHPASPPAKRPLMTLLKQARAFGVGLVVATQNPMDMDYRALSNAGMRTRHAHEIRQREVPERLLALREGLRGVDRGRDEVGREHPAGAPGTDSHSSNRATTDYDGCVAMPSVSEMAAMGSIATNLAPLVTTNQIVSVADALGFRKLAGSNKADLLRDLIAALFAARRRNDIASVVATLAAEALHRSRRGLVKLYDEDIDDVVTRLRQLDVDPGEIAHKRWRGNLPKRTVAPAVEDTQPPRVTAATPSPQQQMSANQRPREYANALAHLRELEFATPQHRGRQLEYIVLEVLRAEGLSPEHRIVNQGEEIDLAFTLEGGHYLVECKWEKEPVGLPVLHKFDGKIVTKAEGTFGVILSMSAFVQHINGSATRGRRLSCIGIGPSTFMNVLEGRTTWSNAVHHARRIASTRGLFLAD